MSGGTDIASCFVLGNPVKPVWSGEIQGSRLGMAVEVFDDLGQPMAKNLTGRRFRSLQEQKEFWRLLAQTMRR